MASTRGLKGDPAGVLADYTELVRSFRNDERPVAELLGNTYFGRQEYDTADITDDVQADGINPSFCSPTTSSVTRIASSRKYTMRRGCSRVHGADFGDPNPTTRTPNC